ncbi:MAG TPA: FG-GAP-like repeat-containing protein [Azospirillum sp.]|nr:FG-GAP-like repeat-containing protein [Azospirillum sp.]
MSDPTVTPAGTDPFGLTDVGGNAVPVLVDVEGDGDSDALVGNAGGDTVLFTNTGTAGAPTFTPTGTNPFGLADVGGNAVPVLADVDGDGDGDAVVGNATGDTVVFTNTGTAGAPTFTLEGSVAAFAARRRSRRTLTGVAAGATR